MAVIFFWKIDGFSGIGFGRANPKNGQPGKKKKLMGWLRAQLYLGLEAHMKFGCIEPLPGSFRQAQDPKNMSFSWSNVNIVYNILFTTLFNFLWIIILKLSKTQNSHAKNSHYHPPASTTHQIKLTICNFGKSRTVNQGAESNSNQGDPQWWVQRTLSVLGHKARLWGPGAPGPQQDKMLP